MSGRSVAVGRPPKPGRDWHTYNLAQTKEALLFEQLLWDLLQAVPEPPYKGNGRPPLAVRDVLFSAITKSYSGLSSRPHQGLVEQAHLDGLLDSIPHFNAVSKLLRLQETKEVLHALVALSALPLGDLEQDFAVDSTGFATGTYGTYRETRYGRIGENVRKRKWIKLHAITGVRTNIITAADAMGAHSSDSPQFPRLVAETAATFQIREVSADKAYSGKANHWAVKEAGGKALIPFKDGKSRPGTGPSSSSNHNVKGLAGSGRLWKKAYHYFCLHEDEFYARYHKRSNVESTFGAIKQRFGERLKSKDFTAQCNEVLCKVVAWNICVLVRVMHEHGIPADFSSSSY